MAEETRVTAAMPDDLRRAVAFHGHLCPGLMIGWRAAGAAAAALEVGRSADEELVLIAENDSCSVDAFQALLSTTFGKGNLVFRDYGKQVFTLGDRSTGRAVRVVLRGDAFPPDLDREAKMQQLLSVEDARLFHVNPVQLELPERARIHETLRCVRCGEGVMSTRTVPYEGRAVCLPCAADLGLTPVGA
jgi:formylmethanofuran dehydrogenase subunit E